MTQRNPGTGNHKLQGKQATRTIPDKPRDCGPHVDTWPILDEQIGDAHRPKTDGKPGKR